MSQYVISMKTDRIDLQQAAHVLEKSQRQVMRDVKAGKLKATGGGHGVDLAFNKADVEAFRRHAAIADADLLARIAYAFKTKHQPPAQRDLLAQTIIKTIRKKKQTNYSMNFMKNLPIPLHINIL